MPTQYATRTELGLFGMTAAALGTFSDEQKDAALQGASDHADGHLGQRFRLPLLGTIPIAIKMHVARIAAWILMSGRGFKPGTTDGETLHQAYKDANAWLEKVAAGTVTPAGITDSDTGEEPGTSETGQGAAFVVSPSSRDTSEAVSRYAEFNGRDVPAPAGVVGPPRVRGW